MDKLSNAQLEDLRNRCAMAASKGYGVANADEYMKALVAETGTKVQSPVTVNNLLQEVNFVLERRAGKAAPEPEPASQKPTVVPPVSLPKPAPVVKPEPAPKEEIQDDLDSLFDEKPTAIETPKGKGKKNKK